jgi:hypothetical protein
MAIFEENSVSENPLEAVDRLTDPCETPDPEIDPTTPLPDEPDSEPEVDEASRTEGEIVGLLNARYAWNNALKCVIEFYWCPRQRQQAYRLIKLADFSNSVANWLWQYHPLIPFSKGDPTHRTAGALWVIHPNRRTYEGIVFQLEDVPPNMRDMYLADWQGFAFKPDPNGNCDLYWQHVFENICNGDKGLFEWLKAWMAFTVQFPGKPSRVAFAMNGPRGVGKGFFAQSHGKLFGHNFHHGNRPDDLTHRFNDHLRYKAYVFLDEMFWAGDHSKESVLKGLITEDTMVFEKKFIQLEVVRSVISLVIASNNAWFFPAGQHERRVTVTEVSAAKMQNKGFFESARKQLENDGGYERLLYDLLNYDLKAPDAPDPEVFYQTAALTSQQIETMLPEHAFWFEILQNGRIASFHQAWGEYCNGLPVASGQLLYDSFCAATKKAAVGRARYKGSFTKAIKLMIPTDEPMKQFKVAIGVDNAGLHKQAKDRCFVLPSIQECRDHFETMYPNIKWDIPTDQLDTAAVRAPAVLDDEDDFDD